MNDRDAVSPERIRIGVSSCLLGRQVRYDGGHKRNAFVADVLGAHFDLVPFCPEVAIGLGVPRPSIRLTGDPRAPRARRTADGRDVTDLLDAYGREVAAGAGSLSGYVLKSRSRSCGMERVEVHGESAHPRTEAIGIHARALMRALPLLPLEEEERLDVAGLRDSFIERVLAFHRWQCLVRGGLTVSGLMSFHAEHKYLLMAHDAGAARDLGRAVANAARGLDAVAASYITRVMQVLGRPARRAGQVNALRHLSGYFKRRLDAGDRAELADAVERFRCGAVPILVPLTLIRRHLRRHPDAYLESQHYLEQRPAPLDTRSR